MAMSDLPKYEQVKRSLMQEIELGRWAPGSAIASEAQLLKRFAVSRPTLVRSLQELVREGYLYRRQGKGTFIAERSAREGNGQTQQSIPVFTVQSADALGGGPGQVLLRLLNGAQAVLGPAHVNLALRYAPPGTIDEETRRFLDKAEPGTALMIEPSFAPPLRIELQRRGWAVWAVNEPLEDGNCVYIDQERAGYLATQHLLKKKGRRRVALLNGPVESYWGFAARRDGYLAALEEMGVAPDPKLIREDAHISDTEAGRAMMRGLLTEGVVVDGVVGASDSKAMGAIAAARDAGLRIPDDLAVVSIDNIFAERVDPPLTSVAMPFLEVGERAAEEALRRSSRNQLVCPVEIKLKPSLVERP
jgi:DNA-binding LacI/PurR family transcriptional regulator